MLQTTVSIRLYATVAKVSSVQQPANTGEKCQGSTSPGTGTKEDTQAWSSVAWLGGTGCLWLTRVGSTRHRGVSEWADGWPVTLKSLNILTMRLAGRLHQRGHILCRRLSNSLNNIAKGWCKPSTTLSLKHSREPLGICMSSSQYWLPGVNVQVF